MWSMATSPISDPFYYPKVIIPVVLANPIFFHITHTQHCLYRGADKSLTRPGTKQVTAAEDFEFHVSYLQS